VSNVHIYVASSQPATRFKVDVGSVKPFWVKRAARSLVGCWCCRKRRWAKHVRVQVYYDSIRYWCAPGHGCKA